MSNRITMVSTKGQFVIPVDIRESLGISPGTRISVTLEGTKIVLEPVSEEMVNQTRGLFRGRPSLSAALKRERRHKDKW